MKTWSSWDIIRHRVAICGRVMTVRGERVCGVTVNIVSMPDDFLARVSAAASAAEKKWDDLDERLDRTVTRVDGIFYFLDLPAGRYTLSFDVCNHSPEEKKAAVLWDILPAARNATQGNIITPYKLMPHDAVKIPGDISVEYEVEDQ